MSVYTTLEKLIIIFKKSVVLMCMQQAAYCIVQGGARHAIYHSRGVACPVGRFIQHVALIVS